MIYRGDFPDSQSYLDALFRARRRRIQLTVIIIVACIVGTLAFLYEFYKVRHVLVEGNTRYTDEEITQFVESGFLGNNSLVLSLRYANKDVPDVPFVERMDVDVLQHDSIRITVYEMALAGYVDYLGQYMYFSRDGTVVESSNVRLQGVPEVLGLKFSHIALYEQLPVDDPAIFQRILNVTQMLTKYDLDADKIYFDSDGEMSIYFGGVRCDVGNEDYLDEKISNISRILPDLQGKRGTLKMASYTPDTNYITFVVSHMGRDADTEDSDGDERGSADSTREVSNIPIITVKDKDGNVISESSAADTASTTEDTMPVIQRPEASDGSGASSQETGGSGSSAQEAEGTGDQKNMTGSSAGSGAQAEPSSGGVTGNSAAQASGAVGGDSLSSRENGRVQSLPTQDGQEAQGTAGTSSNGNGDSAAASGQEEGHTEDYTYGIGSPEGAGTSGSAENSGSLAGTAGSSAGERAASSGSSETGNGIVEPIPENDQGIVVQSVPIQR